MKNVSIIWAENDKIMKWTSFVENKTEVMQQILLFPAYIKWICRGVFYVRLHLQTGLLKVNI